MVVWTNGDAPTSPTTDATERPGPLPRAVRRDHADVEPAVVGRRVGERREATEHVADVADEHAARLVLEPRLPVDLDRHPHGVRAHVLRAGPDVRDAPDLVLQARRRRRGSSSRRAPRRPSPRSARRSSCRRRACGGRRAARSGRTPRGPRGCRGWWRTGWRCRRAGSRS